MITGPKGTEFELCGRFSVCGHLGEIFNLPGRVEKYCLECSADVAAVILLTTEIDAPTLAGANANELISEFTLINNRMLGRAQSSELGNFWTLMMRVSIRYVRFRALNEPVVPRKSSFSFSALK